MVGATLSTLSPCSVLRTWSIVLSQKMYAELNGKGQGALQHVWAEEVDVVVLWMLTAGVTWRWCRRGINASGKGNKRG